MSAQHLETLESIDSVIEVIETKFCEILSSPNSDISFTKLSNELAIPIKKELEKINLTNRSKAILLTICYYNIVNELGADLDRSILLDLLKYQ